MRIATLGWGPLVWDPRGLPLFTEWVQGGPVLPIEFCRVSSDGRLTLVIDQDKGADTPTRFIAGARSDFEDAVCDLGYVDLAGDFSRGADAGPLDAVRVWAASHGFDAVVWTALPSNFWEKTSSTFWVRGVARYLRTPSYEVAGRAREYVEQEPAEGQIPLRRLYVSGELATILTSLRAAGPLARRPVRRPDELPHNRPLGNGPVSSCPGGAQSPKRHNVAALGGGG
jgi:hypothetical protein